MKISFNNILSGFNIAKLNDNFTKLQNELQNRVLYRDNPSGEPNAVQTDIDMNGKNLLNVGTLDLTQSISLNGLDLATQVNAAAASATLSQNWATKTNAEVVVGQGYGAKKYSIDANTYSQNALSSANLSQNWATQLTTEVVAGQGYSARQYAANSSASATSAQNWATQMTTEVVAGQGYSAKQYAQNAQTYITNAGLPLSLTGSALKYMRVNSTATGYEHRSPQQALLDLGVPMRGYLDGFQMSTAGSSNTFSVGSGTCADDTNQYVFSLAGPFTKTTAAWASGSGVGGLDTGTIAASTWYHVFAIYNPTTQVSGILFSLSLTPTMPSGYTAKRRIGSLLTDASSNWTKFQQRGDDFIWDTPITDIAGSTYADATAKLLLLSVPRGVIVKAIITGYMGNSAGGSATYRFSDPNTADIATTGGTALGGSTLTPIPNFHISTSSPQLPQTMEIFTDTSAQIRGRSSAAGTSNVVVLTNGWKDLRGKNQ